MGQHVCRWAPLACRGEDEDVMTESEEEGSMPSLAPSATARRPAVPLAQKKLGLAKTGVQQKLQQQQQQRYDTACKCFVQGLQFCFCIYSLYKDAVTGCKAVSRWLGPGKVVCVTIAP